MLEILKIQKKFVNSTVPVLDGVSLRVEEGECLSLLGPSGCGKTTLLRILAGLETPDSGEILLDGKNLLAMGPAERPFHMVFQKQALFPHLSVFDNVAFGLRVRKTPEKEIELRVSEALALVRLDGFAKRKPSTLSGGQAQRVALARALINHPRVLLLDEPFSALDLKLRESMATELRDLQKRLKLTFIFVTHDQQEAFSLSDRVALMNKGRFEQVSPPREMYQRPQSLYAAHFVGSVSKLPIDLVHSQIQDLVEFESGGARMKGRSVGPKVTAGKSVALIRPESMFLKSQSASAKTDNQIDVVVEDWIFRGSFILLRARNRNRQEVLVSLNPFEVPDLQLQVGQKLSFHFRSEDTLLCLGGCEDYQ